MLRIPHMQLVFATFMPLKFGIFSIGGSKKRSSGKYNKKGSASSTETGTETQTSQTDKSASQTSSQLGTQQSNSAQDVARNIASQTFLNDQTAQNTSQTTSGQQNSTSAQNTSAQQITSTLSQDVQDQLSQMISTLAQSTDQQTNLTDFVVNNAMSNAAGGSQNAIDAIVASARNKGETAIGRNSVAAAQNAGSSMNSIVQQLGIEGRVKLETDLAALAGQLGLQFQQQNSQDLANAAQIAGGSTDAIANLANVLKGAETSATSTQQQDTTQLVQDLQNLIGNTNTDKTSRSSQNTVDNTKTNTLSTVLSQMDTSTLSQETQTAISDLLKALQTDKSFTESGKSKGKVSGVSAGFKI